MRGEHAEVEKKKNVLLASEPPAWFDPYEDSLILVRLETLYQRRQKLLYSFGKKCINIEQTKHLFIKKKTEHPMSKRYQETFQVVHANTERLRNSTVPYIQRLLNKKA